MTNEAQKRIDVLIKAAAILNNHDCPCNVLLIGDDSEREKLNKLVMGEGIEDRVYSCGRNGKTSEHRTLNESSLLRSDKAVL